MASKVKADANRAVKEMYAEFLRLPNAAARAAAGLPRTKKEFAEQYGKERTTLWHWEQDPDFRREVHNDVLGALSVDEVERIKWSLKVKAFDGNVAASRLLLEWAGLYGRYASKPEAPAGLDVSQFEKMSDAELEALIEQEDYDEQFSMLVDEEDDD